MHILKNDALEGVRGAVISREPVLQHNIIRDFSCFFCNLWTSYEHSELVSIKGMELDYYTPAYRSWF